MSGEPLRCAGALILDDGGRIFIQRRSPTRALFPGSWDIVGGHLEPGESFDDALRREVFEETGWRLSHILGELSEIRYEGDDGLTRVERDFLVRVEGDLRLPHLAESEHTEWRWINRSQLDETCDRETLGGQLVHRLLVAGFRVAAEMGLTGGA